MKMSFMNISFRRSLKFSCNCNLTIFNRHFSNNKLKALPISLCNNYSQNFITKSNLLSVRFKYNALFHRNFASDTSNLSILKVPPMGDSVSSGTVIEHSKNVGDFVEVDDVIVVIETDKTSLEVRADKPGKICKFLANIEDTVQIDDPLVEIDISASKDLKNSETLKEHTKKSQTKTSESEEVTSGKEANKETEPVKKASKIESTSKKDEKILKSEPSLATKTPSGESQIFYSSKSKSRNQRIVKLSRMRLKIAERLKASQNTTASLTTFNEIDCSNIMNLRKRFKDEFLEKHGVKLGFMSAFVRASTLALLQQPAVNSTLDLENQRQIFNDFVDISVAVAAPQGLVVPVLRNTEKMSFVDIERQIVEYGRQAKQGKIALEDMAGGTFTISNGGIFGSLMGTPIINPPQSAILGMHGIFNRPIASPDGKEVVIRPMMYIALTYDHRIIDGRDAVLFLRKIKSIVEDPVKIIFDL